jgi:hypothetical protein
MNSKKILNIIIGFMVLLLSYSTYVFFAGKQTEMQNIQNNANLTETSLRVSDDYIPEKWEDKGKTIWNGLGFEPGFILEIKERKNIESTLSEFPTKITFQENGEVEGVLNYPIADKYGKYDEAKKDVIVEYSGSLFVGGDGAVSTEVKIIKKDCVRPSGEKNDFIVNIVFGDDKYTGCAKIVN